MTPATIQRYQPGGDIYVSLASRYGQGGADRVARAALTGDATFVNAELAVVKSGPRLNDSTFSLFTSQIVTDPLAAPLESANTAIGNSVASLFRNPWVLAVTVLVVAGLVLFYVPAARRLLK